MKLGIDLRFYRPEPYGLAIHIRDLCTELIPLLKSQQKFQKIVLIMDKAICNIPLDEFLPWWNEVRSNELFEVVFVPYKYYTFSEQLQYFFFLQSLRADLIYFFTFNYPILYKQPFLYQVLDLSIPKTRSGFSLKIQSMLFCLRSGLKNATHILFLGQNTKSDATNFSSLNFNEEQKQNYRKNTVIYNGISKLYQTIPTSNIKRASFFEGNFDENLAKNAKDLLNRLKVTKPYFLFVSVWRKYKNIERLVDAFEMFQNENGHVFQLILAGPQDEKYPEILQRVKASEEYKRGNIIVPGKINTDNELIYLYDHAEALIAPSLSEGFGLYLVEAGIRGCSIICSDIPIFHEIAGDDGGIFFDPYSSESMYKALISYFQLGDKEKQDYSMRMHNYSKKFSWDVTARTILDTILKIEL